MPTAFSSWLRRTLVAGIAPAVATTAMAALCGKLEIDNLIAPINAVSHIIWGDEAAAVHHFTFEHTVLGLLLNATAVTMWAGVYHFVVPWLWPRRNVLQSVIAGAALAGIAYIVDYQVVPERLTPGFEKLLSGASLLAIYAALGLSLALADTRRSS